MSELVKINDSEIDSLIIKAKKTALVFVSAVWSAPAKICRPNVEQAANEFQNKLAFFDLDIDANSLTPAKYGVKGVPAVLIFKNGQINNVSQGIINKSTLSALIGNL